MVDADHVPLPHALERTLGFFGDPEVAFVQTPQVFFNRGFQHPRGTDDPLLNEQSLFYDVINRGKDRHRSVFWCGSSAVLRRDALVSIGGVATETVVEDTHTAMRLQMHGWHGVYHHEVLAVGLAPEEVTAFLTQRGRWARGSFQMLRNHNPLLAKGLDWHARVHYFSSLSHYLEGPQRMIAVLVPTIVLFTGIFPLAAPPVLYLALLLPQLVLVPLATKAMARGSVRLLDAERFALARAVTYTKAAAALFTRRPLSFAVTPKGPDGARTAWLWALRWQIGLAVASVCAIGFQTVAQLEGLPQALTPFGFAVTAVWAVSSIGFTAVVVHWAATVRHRRRAHRFPVRLEASYAVADSRTRPVPAIVTDLSPYGLALAPATRGATVTEGDELLVALRSSGLKLDLKGTVVRLGSGKRGEPHMGVLLDEIEQEKRDAITRWCFTHPFGPDHPIISGSAAPLPPADTERRAA